MNTTTLQQSKPRHPQLDARDQVHPHVLELHEARCRDLQVAGGKGSGLASLHAMGFPVPPGFVVSSSAYDEFLRPAHAAITELIRNRSLDDPGAVADLSVRVRDRLQDLDLPVHLGVALRETPGACSSDHGYAIRSSSTLEDLAGAAFAGMHETWLNCHGLATVLEKIKSCYLSLWSEQAISYRHHKGFRHLESRMAVVVQSMVDCEVAGVGFSIHPVTGDLRTMVINANAGLGDTVVNGEHEVDHLEIEKSTGVVSRAVIGRKTSKLVCDARHGGTREELVEADRARDACLTSWQVEQLSALLLQVEEATGFPQDI